ncbi:hypothetical protein DH2020_024485 [Rehmannia glutinosa]|uniref:RNase H type-1 domain-containing protein n=1 Tax=Rehmannia glutinosa TaxID=99300 RepID=A0ABR0W4U0_REHGL
MIVEEGISWRIGKGALIDIRTERWIGVGEWNKPTMVGPNIALNATTLITTRRHWILTWSGAILIKRRSNLSLLDLLAFECLQMFDFGVSHNGAHFGGSTEAAAMVGVIGWTIWKARNRKCFESTEFCAQDVVFKAINLFHESQDIIHTNQSNIPRKGIAPPVTQPERPEIKLLTDPTIYKDGTFGYDFNVILWDGTPRLATCKTLQMVGSSTMAEGPAMTWALYVALEYGIKRYNVYSDINVLIDSLKKRLTPDVYREMLIADILELANNFEFMSFDFVPRNLNREAHILEHFEQLVGAERPGLSRDANRSPVEATLFVIRHAQLAAYRLGCKDIAITLDDEDIVKKLNSKASFERDLSTIAKGILLLAFLFDLCDIGLMDHTSIDLCNMLALMGLGCNYD